MQKKSVHKPLQNVDRNENRVPKRLIFLTCWVALLKLSLKLSNFPKVKKLHVYITSIMYILVQENATKWSKGRF